MYLYDLIDRAQLQRDIDDGYVRVQHRASDNYSIYNYTEKAQYSNYWTPVTKLCRGLIVDCNNNKIVARPFPKFMNYGQPGAPEMPLGAPVTVTDKLDGSLGILYRRHNLAWSIATRGSFESEQADRAIHMLYAKDYGIGHFTPRWGVTYLFEIIYPDNRIVVDYGDREDLVLLGGVDIETGKSYAPNHYIFNDWKGPRAEIFNYKTFGEALAAPPRTNSEGFVVHFTGTEERVKIKQEDYIRLHKIVTGLNARSVWEHMMSGEPFVDFLAKLPDEFHDWANQVFYRLSRDAQIACAKTTMIYYDIKNAMRDAGETTRKDFALRAIQHDCKSHLFSLRDGKQIYYDILKNLKPEAGWSPRPERAEDVA